jgi:hypothetical protein
MRGHQDRKKPGRGWHPRGPVWTESAERGPCGSDPWTSEAGSSRLQERSRGGTRATRGPRCGLAVGPTCQLQMARGSEQR